jgi:hypothetical protein
MKKHFFYIKYKDDTSELRVHELDSGKDYFETLLHCVSSPNVKSYRLLTGVDQTDPENEFIKKICERYLHGT